VGKRYHDWGFWGSEALFREQQVTAVITCFQIQLVTSESRSSHNTHDRQEVSWLMARSHNRGRYVQRQPSSKERSPIFGCRASPQMIVCKSPLQDPIAHDYLPIPCWSLVLHTYCRIIARTQAIYGLDCFIHTSPSVCSGSMYICVFYLFILHFITYIKTCHFIVRFALLWRIVYVFYINNARDVVTVLIIHAKYRSIYLHIFTNNTEVRTHNQVWLQLGTGVWLRGAEDRPLSESKALYTK